MSGASAAFSVPAFLERVARGEPPDPAVLEALARKIEVARRVHECYDAQLREPASEALLDPGLLPALGAAFADAAERSGDVKWLNTALKLQHGVLRAPAFAGDAGLEARLSRLLERPFA